jgi:pimeloyl-ACP methyl ester carboxylesterase
MASAPKTTTVLSALLIPLGMVAGAVYAAPRLFRRAFAPPQRDASTSPADLGLPEEQVWLRSATGTRLHGWLIPVDGVRPAVIVLHGWGGNASLMLPLAAYLYRAGFHSLFLDARNHGYSEHDTFVSMPRFAEDLEVAADWLVAHEAVTSIGVVGHSVGAGAAILSASRSSRYAAVVSVSSFAHPGEMMREQMSRMPSPVVTAILEAIQLTIGYRFETFAPRYRLPQVKVPVLLVHGDSDPVVPISDLEELAAVRPDAEVLVVPQGGHSDLAPFEPYVGHITAFLDRWLF